MFPLHFNGISCSVNSSSLHSKLAKTNSELIRSAMLRESMQSELCLMPLSGLIILILNTVGTSPTASNMLQCLKEFDCKTHFHPRVKKICVKRKKRSGWESRGGARRWHFPKLKFFRFLFKTLTVITFTALCTTEARKYFTNTEPVLAPLKHHILFLDNKMTNGVFLLKK